ncbi:helix-hairpin-helix domain-containing protein [Chryseobacterium sp. SNU WT5]|uniref:helix-hairpin-helix domain-containing protein n=1 Tax=Chryseobacterium sp. SNU WT5 TaxID=2594269 RepID=UPI00117E7F9F|nr:helix-hairpin-helix domain-containing protein [Chryseobacterium sp. SNU WT5]QDP86415.1 helix-hairpin-helix domain-containing protein [Chryseobacterium sp. SNU WT5]
MRYSVQMSAAKNYFLGFLTSVIILGAGLYFYNSNNPPSVPEPTFTENNTTERKMLQEFDPNDLDKNDWINLGFSERQVATLLKYKSVVGGYFISKEQFKKCYAVSAEKYQELEPYILLPESSSKRQSFVKNFSDYNSNTYHSKPKKELKIAGKFNPDHYSLTDFINLGFSEKQALSILKYKNYLGGSFISKEKFKECYTISDENYQRLAPYLLLPEKSTLNNTVKNPTVYQKDSSPVKPEINYQPFDPNTTNLEGWQKLGFSPKQAQVIINYRDKNLKGKFTTFDQIASCFVISEEKFEKLKPYIILTSTGSKSSNSEAVKSADNQYHSSKTQDIKVTKTDFQTTELNQMKFNQLIEFGFDEKSAASLIGFRNKLGGFVNKKQIIETYNIDKDLAERLVNIAPLNSNSVTKYTLIDAPESFLKNHPYFKYYADKIIYYRISYPDEKKIFKLMAIKPEAEQKMRLYLK